MFKDRLLLSEAKIEELYAKLKKLNADIYMQRSQQMKARSPIRTRLFAWLMSDLEICLMADPSIAGPENVVRIMTEIDAER